MDAWAQRRTAGGRVYPSAFFSFLLIGTLVASAGCGILGGDPPETAPTPPEQASGEGTPTGQTGALVDLRAEAESFYDSAEEAYRRGEYATAENRFRRALGVYLDADVPEAEQPALKRAVNDLFNRYHALTVEDLIDEPDELVMLDDEELPPPSEEDLARLRARLEVTPPELPKFSIDVPSPLENERVEWALAYLTSDRKEVIEEGLSRATRYMPMIESIFDEVGVPRELAWSALIESLFKTGAYSRAAAVGMWQFVSGTARLYGMEVSQNVDERRDPVVATRMAAIYMRDLYEEFGDWALVMAAYNAGKGRLGRAMQRTGQDDFWSLAAGRALPRETRDHIPKVYAAMLIGSDPELYGLTVTEQPPYVYDEVVMDYNTDLRLVADLAGVSFEDIREYNPHIMTWVPEGYPVRVPAGTRADFVAALDEVPPGERIEFLTHVVARGQTLSHIAAQYPGTSMRSIIEANDMRNANRLSIGQRLFIPVGPETRPYRAQPVAGFDTGERTTYRVQRGDTLYDIAQTFRTDSANVMRWNNLSSGRIYPGDELIVYFGVRGNMATPAAVSSSDRSTSTGPEASNAERGLYTVRRGDSLYEIARRFDVSVDELKGWNSSRSNTIHPGDKLVVYSPAMATDDTGSAGVTTVQNYTVRRGDSPYLIAQRHDVDLGALLAANGLSRRSSIYPGDELLIPGGDATGTVSSYTVRRGDTLGTIAQRHGVSLTSLLRANGLSPRSVIHPGDALTIPGR